MMWDRFYIWHLNQRSWVNSWRKCTRLQSTSRSTSTTTRVQSMSTIWMYWMHHFNVSPHKWYLPIDSGLLTLIQNRNMINCKRDCIHFLLIHRRSIMNNQKIRLWHIRKQRELNFKTATGSCLVEMILHIECFINFMRYKEGN